MFIARCDCTRTEHCNGLDLRPGFFVVLGWGCYVPFSSLLVVRCNERELPGRPPCTPDLASTPLELPQHTSLVYQYKTLSVPIDGCHLMKNLSAPIDKLSLPPSTTKAPSSSASPLFLLLFLHGIKSVTSSQLPATTSASLPSSSRSSRSRRCSVVTASSPI